MGYDGKTITAPVSDYDICRALGENTLDIGSLCQSKSINKYSFHKPMNVDTPLELTLEQKYAIDGGYDLTDMVKDTLLDVANSYTGNNHEWEYVKPEIWGRFTDFIGYNSQAGDFSPTCTLHVPTDKGFATLDIAWNSDVQPHISKFKTYNEQSSNNLGFRHLGVLFIMGSTPYFYFISLLPETSQNSFTLFFEEALHEALQSTPTAKYNVKVVPLLVDCGIGVNAAPPLFSKDKMYTNDQLKNNGVGQGQHQYAPFKMLALGSTPFEFTFKTLLYRTFDNITADFVWYSGGYSFGFGDYEGDVSVWNQNNFQIYLKVQLLGNGYLEEQGNSNSWVTLHETKSSEPASSPLYGYVPIDANQVYSALQHGGITTNSWEIHESIDYAQIMLVVSVKVYIDGVYYEKSYSHSWSHANGTTFTPIYETIKFVE